MNHLILQCIGAARLLEDADAAGYPGVGTASVPKLAAAIIGHILQGHTLKPSNLSNPDVFTDYVFKYVNRTRYLQMMGKPEESLHPNFKLETHQSLLVSLIRSGEASSSVGSWTGTKQHKFTEDACS